MKFLSAFVAHSLQPAKQAGGLSLSPDSFASSINESNDAYSAERGMRALHKRENEFSVTSPDTGDTTNSETLNLKEQGPDNATPGAEIKATVSDLQSLVPPINSGLDSTEGNEHLQTNQSPNQQPDQQPSVALPNSSITEKFPSKPSIKKSKNDIDINESMQAGTSEDSKLISQAINARPQVAGAENQTIEDSPLDNKTQQAMAYKKHVSEKTNKSEEQTIERKIDGHPALVAEYGQAETSPSYAEQHMRTPLSQSQSRHEEMPQVRIGHVNVLIDDRASSKPKCSTSKVTAPPSNSFGLRGL